MHREDKIPLRETNDPYYLFMLITEFDSFIQQMAHAHQNSVSIASSSFDLSIHTTESIIFTDTFELTIPRHKDLYDIVNKINLMKIL
jgi:hypothetical protein